MIIFVRKLYRLVNLVLFNMKYYVNFHMRSCRSDKRYSFA